MPASTENRHVQLGKLLGGSRPYHHEVARLAVKYSKDGDSIIDIGTGAGNVAYLISQVSARSIDVADAYQSCLDAARQRLPVRRAYLIDEEAFDIANTIPRGQYSVVTMSHVVEHLMNPVQGIRDALTLLRPGGHLILAVPNPVRPLVFLYAMLRIRYSNRGHVVVWDRSHWMTFLESVLRLEVLEYGSDYVELLPNGIGWLRPVEIALVRVVPWLSFSNIAVVRCRENPSSVIECA